MENIIVDNDDLLEISCDNRNEKIVKLLLAHNDIRIGKEVMKQKKTLKLITRNVIKIYIPYWLLFNRLVKSNRLPKEIVRIIFTYFLKSMVKIE